MNELLERLLVLEQKFTRDPVHGFFIPTNIYDGFKYLATNLKSEEQAKEFADKTEGIVVRGLNNMWAVVRRK